MGLFERYQKKKSENNHNDVVKYSSELFQLREYNDEIWLTYDSHLVCPCSMLNAEPVDAIKKMRELYIERTPKLTRI